MRRLDGVSVRGSVAIRKPVTSVEWLVAAIPTLGALVSRLVWSAVAGHRFVRARLDSPGLSPFAVILPILLESRIAVSEVYLHGDLYRLELKSRLTGKDLSQFLIATLSIRNRSAEATVPLETKKLTEDGELSRQSPAISTAAHSCFGKLSVSGSTRSLLYHCLPTVCLPSVIRGLPTATIA